jgi:hypothetical protein
MAKSINEITFSADDVQIIGPGGVQFTGVHEYGMGQFRGPRPTPFTLTLRSRPRRQRLVFRRAYGADAVSTHVSWRVAPSDPDQVLSTKVLTANRLGDRAMAHLSNIRLNAARGISLAELCRMSGWTTGSVRVATVGRWPRAEWGAGPVERLGLLAQMETFPANSEAHYDAVAFTLDNIAERLAAAVQVPTAMLMGSPPKKDGR